MKTKSTLKQSVYLILSPILIIIAILKLIIAIPIALIWWANNIIEGI